MVLYYIQKRKGKRNTALFCIICIVPSPAEATQRRSSNSRKPSVFSGLQDCKHRASSCQHSICRQSKSRGTSAQKPGVYVLCFYLPGKSVVFFFPVCPRVLFQTVHFLFVVVFQTDMYLRLISRDGVNRPFLYLHRNTAILTHSQDAASVNITKQPHDHKAH